MTDEPATPVSSRRLEELSRLASLLAMKVLNEQAAGQAILDVHIHALLDAAILLDKYEAELPAALNRIVDQVDDARSKAEDGTSGLAWLLRPFQGGAG